MLLAFLSLSLCVTVFVLLCLYFCIGNVSFVGPKALRGSNLPTAPWQTLCPPLLPLGSCILKVLSGALESQSPSAMSRTRPASISWHHDAHRWPCAGLGAAAPWELHATEIPSHLLMCLHGCYSQLNYSIMTSLLSPNSPNYSLEIYYLIW